MLQKLFIYSVTCFGLVGFVLPQISGGNTPLTYYDSNAVNF